MEQQDFLVELGTEELPPTALKNLMLAFAEGIRNGLKSNGISHGSIEPYATPRRLAVIVRDMAAQTEFKELTVWGPPASIAYDKDGNPTKAAEAFASKNSVAVTDLETGNDGKADKLFCINRSGGENSSQFLSTVVVDSLNKLPIPKRMRWGSSREEFVRPVQWLVMLSGSEVVQGSVLGLTADRITRGHRFHCDQALSIESVDDYLSILESTGFVIADYDRRQSIILQQVESEATKANGKALLDQDLLDEVTALVEWPVALTGGFEDRFLEVPAEALIYSMKEHQKYFPVVDSTGALLPRFITVSNLQSLDPSQIIDGNERVIRPRLSDAAFFFETDKKTSLESFRDRLKSIVFQAKLGTVFEKTERIEGLCQYLANALEKNQDQAMHAARLCKSDLVSDMVGEFDKMQGLAGYYYALNEGLDQEVACAIKEHYLPKFAGDELPETFAGTLVALADRLDTLVGIFGIGEKPTGSKDPFALRRASLAVLRILVEKELSLDLKELIKASLALHGNSIPKPEETLTETLSYMMERFRAWYEDKGVSPQVFQSVAAMNLSQPLDFHQRIEAVQSFAQLPEAESLANANKRVSNILSKNQLDDTGDINPNLFQAPAETQLFDALTVRYDASMPLLAQRNYQRALSEMADLKGPIDDFFDNVMVMVDDPSIRDNRMALLSKLRQLFLGVADISLLSH